LAGPQQLLASPRPPRPPLPSSPVPALLSQAYFEGLGFVIPPRMNPADAYLDIISGAILPEAEVTYARECAAPTARNGAAHESRCLCFRHPALPPGVGVRYQPPFAFPCSMRPALGWPILRTSTRATGRRRRPSTCLLPGAKSVGGWTGAGGARARLAAAQGPRGLGQGAMAAVKRRGRGGRGCTSSGRRALTKQAERKLEGWAPGSRRWAPYTRPTALVPPPKPPHAAYAAYPAPAPAPAPSTPDPTLNPLQAFILVFVTAMATVLEGLEWAGSAAAGVDEALTGGRIARRRGGQRGLYALSPPAAAAATAVASRRTPGFLRQYWWCLSRAVLKRTREPLLACTEYGGAWVGACVHMLVYLCEGGCVRLCIWLCINAWVLKWRSRCSLRICKHKSACTHPTLNPHCHTCAPAQSPHPTPPPCSHCAHRHDGGAPH
jgi:hypothetical protein